MFLVFEKIELGTELYCPQDGTGGHLIPVSNPSSDEGFT